MATEKMTMPKLGESVTEGTISKWLVNVGDVVNKYDPIAEVTTDKVNSEIPSSFSGKILELTAEEGATLEVGEVICVIEVEGSKSPDQPEENPNVQSQELNGTHLNSTDENAEEASLKKRYSPAVLRLSGEHGIDLNQVTGSGKGGRITRKDLQKIIESGNLPKENLGTAPGAKAIEQPAQTAPLSGRSIPSVTSEAPSVQPGPGDVEIPLTGVRRAIAANMVRSKHEAPHAWTMVEVDVTELVRLRNAQKGLFKEREGINLTFLPFFIKAIVESLKEYPRMNSTWAGDKIIEKRDINISLAVATEDALYVPVIKRADELTVKGLARSVQDLAIKVRSGKLGPEDMQDGTFTVNNTGSFGSIQSQPILNYPQAAILSVESIVKRPVIINDMIAVRDMVNLCLSLDHRVLDGLIAGRFLQSVKTKLEAMTLETTSIY
ncbi:dihydrolipoamide acetyltransferase family protein [Pullulanibacillus sp. KACC 23026]|uniref:dihydrolipoamide acetyltransferase family protein n=1 Tax=Pullulanibacillus sp. KACC 23026 TaxID=3028315 RepID=UPI0023B154FB|nr:dihydrolipoamide acetyltransferase family protein [Pullulanibacillus sp. KACC 23026]WEG14336.1 dihydrolipoamide acetyltransferase family protein [Pullulanibacillus sp. KACC 23026]